MTTTPDNHLILYRAYTPRGAFGRLVVGDQSFCTVERPWLGNKSDVSCIPPGVYTLHKRVSGVVQRTTHGQYAEGWEVTNVPNRSEIMVHVGNTIDDLEGCIAVGLSTGVLPDHEREPQWGVLNSLAAFKMLMSLLEAQDTWTLDIRTETPEWP